MLDLDLAERLGYERPNDIRKLIDRHMDTLIEFGICATVALIHDGAGRPADAYLLNEEQAIYIATQSDAPILSGALFQPKPLPRWQGFSLVGRSSFSGSASAASTISLAWR